MQSTAQATSVLQPGTARASQCELKSTAQATSVLQPGTARASAECGEGSAGPPDGVSASQCGARVLDFLSRGEWGRVRQAARRLHGTAVGRSQAADAAATQAKVLDVGVGVAQLCGLADAAANAGVVQASEALSQ